MTVSRRRARLPVLLGSSVQAFDSRAAGVLHGPPIARSKALRWSKVECRDVLVYSDSRGGYISSETVAGRRRQNARISATVSAPILGFTTVAFRRSRSRFLLTRVAGAILQIVSDVMS